MNVKVINHSNNPLPQYATEGSAAMDLRVSFSDVFEDMKTYGTVIFSERDGKKVLTIYPGSRALLPTGLHFEIPVGYQISARPRSGLAFKSGIDLTNSVGLIDSDYRGEVMVGIINRGNEPVDITDGDRVCQILLEKVNKIEWELTDTLSETDRGVGGFGSTGKN